MVKNNKSRKNNSLSKNQNYEKFDVIFSSISRKIKSLEKSPSKKKELDILSIGYELLQKDSTKRKSSLSEFLDANGCHQIKDGRNPYLPVVNLCFGKYKINKNTKTKYGHALYYAIHQEMTVEKFAEKIKSNISKLADKGSKLIREDYPETNSSRLYQEGKIALKKKESLGCGLVSTLVEKGNKLIAIIAWLDKDKINFEIKHIVGDDVTKRLIKEFGKKKLSKE